jgi:hypothetical protein
MDSHHYDYTLRDVVRRIGPSLAVLALVALVVRVGVAAGLLPSARPLQDMDHTILSHQAVAALTAGPAEMVLLGDSSCLMGVEPVRLAARTGRSSLGLATMSYLGLEAQGRLLAAYARRHPGSPRWVLLLMHPEALRLRETSSYHEALLSSLIEGQGVPDQPGALAGLQRLLGLSELRNRVLSRCIPVPLAGEFGQFYGFSTDLWRHLERHRGAAVDPNRFSPAEARGNAEYRLAKRIEADCHAFRRQLPAGTRLAVGLTPSPAGFVLANHAETAAGMLRQSGVWLEPDLLLTNLPVTLPNGLFASTTHLNGEGRRVFTEAVARELSKGLPTR